MENFPITCIMFARDGLHTKAESHTEPEFFITLAKFQMRGKTLSRESFYPIGLK